ncbi:MATE family efflux transporter [Beduini massiliensis]|uniref:MATE family efflux transporter n=1 Tax=Beduini massiliensis TaxID=1585974 RepID=UPI00059A9608|nr:MATE family efflux transporter [Beduini massiliensis]
MKQKETGLNGITEGIIWKQLLFFFFPILVGTFFQQLYNTIDAIIVGQYVGKEALAAVGSTGSLINLLVGFFVGLSSGATVIIAQFFGARDDESVSKAVHTSIALSIVGGAIIMVIGIIFAPSCLKAMGVPSDIMHFAVDYTRIYFIGMIASLIYNMGSGILRAIGDSKRPLYFLIISCFVNIVLDALFVIIFKMNVIGVGIATVISQIVSALLTMVVLMRTNQSYKLYLRKIRFYRDILNHIITIGLPAGLQSVMYSVSNIIIQSNINAFGTDTIAAWAAYGKIDSLFWMAMGAFGVSITTFVGQNFGAKKFDRVKKSVVVCLKMAMGVSIALSVILFFFGGTFSQLFTNDAAVIEKSSEIIRFLTPFYFTYVCVEILSGAIRGTGESLKPMILTCLGICVLRVAWILVIVPLYPTFTMVTVSYPVTWAATSILFIIYYVRGSWLKKHIEKEKEAV